ncbi:MAG: Flp family type IVb pilin [Magnetospirillum sp. WYHS-4]
MSKTVTRLAGEVRRLFRSVNGATSIEYALIAAGIVIAIVVAITNYVDKVGNMYNNITNAT